MSLNAGQRKRVAEYLFRQHTWFIKADGVFTKAGWGSFIVFDPTYYPQQKDAFVTKIAELLRADFSKSIHLLPKFVAALATQSIPDLEALCFELIGDGDE